MSKARFSDQLDSFVKSHQDQTLAAMSETFGERSFAILILLLMAPAALPLPTGGVTHIFEIGSMLLALEMIAGRTTLWLPRRIANLKISKLIKGKVFSALVRLIRWFERHSHPHLSELVQSQNFGRLIGAILFLLALAAFAAPPFSGLDTLPALGTVMVALGIILGDAMVIVAGVLVGAVGAGLVIGLGSLAFNAFHNLI